MNNPVKLFIVEGEDRDYRFVNEMVTCFFSSGKFKSEIINLPAEQNIYMLYKELEKDDFETDIVEVLREKVPDAAKKLTGIARQNIDEVYMFFDYDIHQDNIGHNLNHRYAEDVLKKMLDLFDNETEYGKLYISYPMVEALYDYIDSSCLTYSKCFVPLSDVPRYKNISGQFNPNASKRMDIEHWKMALNVFSLRVRCLFNLESLDFLEYRTVVNPLTIYEKETELKESIEKVFVLSAFPEFLFDYFKSDFWNTMTQIKKYKFESCPKNR